MPCQDVSELMSLSFDNRLSVSEQADLDRHMAACDACRDEWGYLRRMNALLAGAIRVQPPPGFTNHVMARIRQRILWRSIVRRGSMILAFSVLIAVFLSVLILLISPVVVPYIQVPLFRAVIAFFERSNGLLLTCGNAFRLVLNAVFNSSFPFVVIGYLMVAVVLVIWWTRVLLVPVHRAAVEAQDSFQGQGCQ